jgi:gamma-glutamyltranspeptidase/glutathione hydrolase/leukotriene-C4 hydrolase
MSNKTGIILNNEIQNFKEPNMTCKHHTMMTSTKFTSPMEQTLSSMAPSIFTDEAGDIRLIIGGTGGNKIITSVAYVSTNIFHRKVLSALDSTVVYQIWPTCMSSLW